ncbi:MAG: DUF4270 family protein [Cyclobacteriaceae bacterium]
MTLLDRMCRPLLLIAAISGLLSCEDPSEVGLSLNPDGTPIDVLFGEVVLPSTNVFIDSLRTDGSSRLLVGRYNDPVFGTTESSANTQLALSKFTFERKADSLTTDGKQIFDYEIDSVILQLRYNFFHSNNFAQEQSIEVRQINDTLFNNVFYLSKFPPVSDENSTLFGQKTFMVNPDVDSLLKINLDVFGEKTLEFLRASSVGSISNDSLVNQLRGIALVPGQNNSALLGFDPTHVDSKLSVHYKIKQIENVQQDSTILDSLSIQFNFANAVRFNSMTTDRSGSTMGIANKSFDSFDVNDGNVYLQSATGIYPRIDLKPFKDFLDQQGSVLVNRCDIEIPLADDQMSSDHINNVGNLRFYFIKEGGNITNSSSSVVLSNVSYLSSTSSGIPASAGLNDDETAYETEITIFTQLINSNSIDVDQLLVVPADITSMNQSIFDKSGIKMKIYYTVPN